MEFLKMMNNLEAQLNADKTFMDRFLNVKVLSTKKYKRACRNRDLWIGCYIHAIDEDLKNEMHKNLTRCEKYLDSLLYNGYTYNDLKKRYSGIV